MSDVPECAGRYEVADPDCDGEKGNDPCAFRLRCKAIQAYCLNNEVDIDEFLDENKTIKKISKKVTVYLPVTRRGKNKNQFLSREYPDTCWHLYEHFEDMMVDAFGKRVSNLIIEDGIKRVVCRPGTLYPVDFLEFRKSINWYCKTISGEGHDLCLCIVDFVATYETINISLVVTPEEILSVLSKRYHESLELKEYNLYNMKSKVLRCDVLQIGLLVDALRLLIASGKVDIPEWRR